MSIPFSTYIVYKKIDGSQQGWLSGQLFSLLLIRYSFNLHPIRLETIGISRSMVGMQAEGIQSISCTQNLDGCLLGDRGHLGFGGVTGDHDDSVLTAFF